MRRSLGFAAVLVVGLICAVLTSTPSQHDEFWRIGASFWLLGSEGISLVEPQEYLATRGIRAGIFGGSMAYIYNRLPEHAAALREVDSLLLFNVAREGLAVLNKLPTDYRFLIPSSVEELRSYSPPFALLRRGADGRVRGIVVATSSRDTKRFVEVMAEQPVPLGVPWTLDAPGRVVPTAVGTAAVLPSVPGPVACGYSISQTSRGFAVVGGSVTVGVTTQSGCQWAAMSPCSWATVSPSGATGSGDVTVTVGSNSGGPRSCGLNIAGQIFSVTQDGVPCSYSITPTSLTFPASGGSVSVTVDTRVDCQWSAASSCSWVAVSKASGTGSGSVTVEVATNSSASRSCTLTIGGQSLAVTQEAAPCAYAISMMSGTFNPSGGSVSVNVATQSGCAWTATSPCSWVTVTPTGASGNGSVTVTVAANSGSARSCTITIAGESFSVTQGAPPPISGSAPSGAVAQGGQGVDWAVIATPAKPAVVWILVESREPKDHDKVFSAGSGAVISADGYILTDAHVVRGASSITVVVEQARHYKATVVMCDDITGIALLKIPASGLRWLRLGDSSSQGDEICVLGYPAYKSSSHLAAMIALAPSMFVKPRYMDGSDVTSYRYELNAWRSFVTSMFRPLLPWYRPELESLLGEIVDSLPPGQGGMDILKAFRTQRGVSWPTLETNADSIRKQTSEDGAGYITVPGRILGFMTKGAVTYVEYDAPTQEGRLGGPLVNSSLEIVGIHTGLRQGGTSSYLGVAVDSFKELIAAWQSPVAMPVMPPILGALPSPASSPKRLVLLDQTRNVGTGTNSLFSTAIRDWYGTTTFVESLKSSGYAAEDLARWPITSAQLAQTSVLIIFGPEYGFRESEIEVLVEFVRRGGGLFLGFQQMKLESGSGWGTNPIARAFGGAFKLSSNIADRAQNFQGDVHIVTVFPTLSAHPITDGVNALWFQGAAIDPPAGAVALLSSTATSWLDMMTMSAYWGNERRDPNEPSGPFSTLAAFEFGQGRVVMAGDSSFLVNDWIGKLDAKRLALNIVDWLARRK